MVWRTNEGNEVRRRTLGGDFLRHTVFAFATALVLLSRPSSAAEFSGAAQYHKDIQPILTEYCFDCHADGMNKGGIALDEFKSDDALLGRRELWWNVLRYMRAGIMPPHKKEQPPPADKQRIADWIKTSVFGFDADNPDPGRVTIRRLNRVEYRNTIHDLMGIDFKTDDEFPPDDTGYGFDNIGDVLTVSPMLLEKYMQAAETIVDLAVPKVAKVVQAQSLAGDEFRALNGGGSGDRMTFYKEANVGHAVKLERAGKYRVAVELNVRGSFDFDPGRCLLVFKIDDREVLRREFGWQDNKKFPFEFDENWQMGEHQLSFELCPLVPSDAKRKTSVDMRIASVEIQGPIGKQFWVRPKNFDRYFSKDVPDDPAQRRQYAREVLNKFSAKAFRQPVDERTLNRLVAIAEDGYQQPGKTFEEGVGRAMVAALASPRFLFRVEGGSSTDSTKPYAAINEYSLASRLSYFLWSTMPDQELLRLAEQGQLRKNLESQVRRMLADSRSKALIENFTGQWLEARDVDGIAIDARTVLARDKGDEKELRRELDEFRARQAKRATQTNKQDQATQEKPAKRPRFFDPPAIELDDSLRRAMRQETQMFFGNILHEDRSVLELIDSDYTFLNEKLARLYGITNVTSTEMRRVTLPKDSPRGGVLTQGAVLVVTSNPTRTSPVKRGLFILDNILGTPPPPPPPDIPLLEDSEKAFKDHEPTLREVLALHREKPLCASCHNRMDPLGLAFENFNALGMWREKERSQPVDTGGTLITGESFKDVRDLKKIIMTSHRLDFYRCLTEKLLTYALGRGLDYYDVGTVDQIVDRLDKSDGRFSALLMGIVESSPFQKRRNLPIMTTSNAGHPPERLAQNE